MSLTGARVLVTGVTGQVALPVARALAVDNDVIPGRSSTAELS